MIALFRLFTEKISMQPVIEAIKRCIILREPIFRQRQKYNISLLMVQFMKKLIVSQMSASRFDHYAGEQQTECQRVEQQYG